MSIVASRVPHRRRLLTCLLLVSLFIPYQASGSQVPAPQHLIAGEVVVGLLGSASVQKVLRVAGLQPESLRSYQAGLDMAVVSVPSGRETSFAASLNRSGLVKYAEPNLRVRGFGTPNDARWSEQWGPAMAGATQAWDIHPNSFSPQGSAASGATVAVVDSGILSSHPDLNDGRIDASLGADCTSGSCRLDPTTDDHGHGTHMAGTIAAATNNNLGVAGVAFNSKLMSVKVLDRSLTGTSSATAAGIYWAAAHGAKVINLSLGSMTPSEAICDAVDIAVRAYGAIAVAAAGNLGVSELAYPAGCPGALAIAATDSTDSRASFSNSGQGLFMAAPGQEVLSTVTYQGYGGHSSGYAYGDGTSMGTAHVSAAVALMSSMTGGMLSGEAARRILAETARKVGPGPYGPDPYGLDCSPGCTWNPEVGYGRLDIESAVSVLSSMNDFSLKSDPVKVPGIVGGTIQTSISVSRYGSIGDVTLTASNLPPGATATFSQNPVGQLSNLTIDISQGTPLGDYEVEILGQEQGLERRAMFVVSVVEKLFWLSMSPTRSAVYQGVMAEFFLEVGRISDFFDPVTLSLDGLPSTAMATLSINPASESSLLRIETGSMTPGSYPFTVIGRAGSVTETIDAMLTVRDPSRTASGSYYASTADVLDFSCLGNTLGGVCFGTHSWEQVATFTVQDESGRPVAVRWAFFDGSDRQITSGTSCNSGVLNIPIGAVALQIGILVATASLHCEGVGPGTWGVVHAAFDRLS